MPRSFDNDSISTKVNAPPQDVNDKVNEKVQERRRRRVSSNASRGQPPMLEQPPLYGFVRILTLGVLTLLFNVVAIVVQYALFRKKDQIPVFPPSVFGVIAGFLALVTAAIDVHLWKTVDKAKIRRWATFQSGAKTALLIASLVSSMTYITMLTLEGISNSGKYAVYFAFNKQKTIVLSAISIVGLLTNIALSLGVIQLTWRPVHKAARSTLAVSSILQIFMGTLILAINWAPLTTTPTAPVLSESLKARHLRSDIFAVLQHFGSIVTATGILGLALCSAISESNRINALFNRFIQFYTTISVIAVCCCVVMLGLSAHLLRQSQANPIQQESLTSDIVLASVGLVVGCISVFSAYRLQAPPESHLAVEPIDLSLLTEEQRAAFAALINKHGKNTPDAPRGEAAISLMQAYVGAELPNMKCTVLRVYRPAMSTRKIALRQYVEQHTSYEDDRAWKNLDEEKMILTQLPPIDTSVKPAADEPPKLTKAQQKKLAKKQAAAGIAAPVEAPISPKTKQMNLEFAAKLEATEALVLMTTISDYDLAGSLKGFWGRALRRTLGADSYFKPLCVKLGLLAFHWPFRESTFYCSPSRRPVARAAAVLRAIADWNTKRPSAERCTVLLDPTYQHEAGDRAIVPSGWQPTPLPASHIIDLRPYKGMTLPEYLKAIKYRDQEAAFKKANGEVIYSKEFLSDECAEVMRLWHKIANKRTGAGETAVLAEPNGDFLQQLGSDHSGDRTLMFLKANGQNVASSVLFRLGDTITSDLQGLDHELARPLKAYFVMMQHVIGIALKEGYNFVDFGPTTAKPKMDIGCKSVPLVAAMYSSSSIISLAIGVAAGNVNKNMGDGSGDQTKEKEGKEGKGKEKEKEVETV